MVVAGATVIYTVQARPVGQCEWRCLSGAEHHSSMDCHSTTGTVVSVWALSLGIPITRMQGLKIAYTSSKTHTDKGSDLGYWSLGWSLMFGH